MHMNTRGITLMSVMVSTVLLGIVALAVTRLLANQSIATRSLNLVAERRQLLEHYRNVVIDGWDKTRRSGVSGAITVYNRSGTSVIPSGGLKLGTSGLYTADANGWWTVTASATTRSGKEVLHSHMQIPKTIEAETLAIVTLKVAFDPEKHPVVSTKFKEVEEKIFLHNNIDGNLLSATKCDSGNSTHKSKLDENSETFYEGDAAIIQYDFKSNYTRCSQVPLVDLSVQHNDITMALRGFQPNQYTYSTTQRVTGKPAYNEKEVTGTAQTYNYITLEATDCGGDSKYIYKIDDTGVPSCSSTHIAPEDKKCEERDLEDQPHNPARGAIYKVDTSGNVTCLSYTDLDNKRGAKGVTGSLNNLSTTTHTVNSGDSSARSKCKSSCASNPAETCPYP